MSGKPVMTVLTVLAAAALFSWSFVIEPKIEKSREYEGLITEVSRSRRWWRTGHSFTSNPADYSYFWHVECDDGKSIRVSVPHRLWKEGDEGARVKKARGERWPVIDTPEYRKQEELRKQIREMFPGD